MTDEIQYRGTSTGSTIYATIRNTSNQYWDAVAGSFETMVPGSWTDYGISLSETPASGYCYVGDFPAAIPAGIYTIDVFEQDGSDPAIDDLLLGNAEFHWDGSAEVPMADILADTNELQAMLDDIDSTGTETITAGKAIEIALAILGGNASYNSTTRVLTIYGRDGTTTLWTVKISNTVAGTRTNSTKA